MTKLSTPLSRSLLHDARAKLDAGLPDQALEILEPFSEADASPPPRENPLLFWRDAAVVLRNAGMADVSAAVWNRAKEAGLDPAVAEMESALARLVAGDFDPQALLDLAASHPRNAVIRNLAALALFESGQREAALDDWDSCRPFSPHRKCPLSTEPVHLALGAMAIERFFLEEPLPPEPPSAAPPERAPGRTRDGRLARINRAFEKRDLDTALRWLDAELEEPNCKPDYLLNLLRAFILGEKNRWTEAREETARALETPSAPPIAESFLACCLTHTGEPQTALAILENVQPAGPDDYFRHYFLGLAHLALGDRIRALHAFLRAFQDYFFDNYHEILVPAWERMARLVRPKIERPAK